jgi:hypothetical protein
MTSPPALLTGQLLAAATEVHRRLPSFPCRMLAYRESVPTGMSGVYVSLSGAHVEHVVGLLAPAASWQALTRALDHDQPRREPRSLVECACEISRALADAFRRTSSEADCVMGLPLFAEGMVSGGRKLTRLVIDVVLGESAALLVLFSRRTEPRPGSSARGDAA